MSADHAPLYYLIAVALLGNVVNVGVSLWTATRVARSQPVRVAEEVRDEMRQLREHWEAFITALNPDHITEIVGRHKKRFDRIEGHLVEHDGLLVALRRDTDALKLKVDAAMEGQEG